MNTRVTILLLSVLVGVAVACVPPDCDTPDCGSCGNACCLINFSFNMNPDEVYETVVSNLKKGGDDMRYMFVNGTDYRKDNITAGVKYQLQASHMTKVNHYNDTLDMLVVSKDPSMTILRGFSISRIEGAYCDYGQNFKNLVGFVKGLGVQFKQDIAFGCNKNPFLIKP